MCDPSVMPTPTHTRLPEACTPASIAVSSSIFLLCVGLYFGPGRGECRQRFQMRADACQRGEGRQVGVEAAGIEHLRYQQHIRQRQRITEAVAAGSGKLARLQFEAAEAFGDPVSIPGGDAVLVLLERAFEVVQDRKSTRLNSSHVA